MNRISNANLHKFPARIQSLLRPEALQKFTRSFYIRGFHRSLMAFRTDDFCVKPKPLVFVSEGVLKAALVKFFGKYYNTKLNTRRHYFSRNQVYIKIMFYNLLQ